MKKLLISLLVLLGILLVPPQKLPSSIPFISYEQLEFLVKYPELFKWNRPRGPIKIAIQVGHLDNDNFPEELAHLRDNDGTQWQNVSEVEINQKVANLMAEILKKKGYIVEILPSTVPQKYFADVFVSIHADGNNNKKISGFKITGPWHDYTQKADLLAQAIHKEYLQETHMIDDSVNISENMGQYYAFSWWRFDHAIHPATTGVIVEMGYLTNVQDRKILLESPQTAASAITRGIEKYLNSQIAEGDLPKPTL